MIAGHLREKDGHYDKLADAIAKAQEKSKSESKPIKKIGFWKSVWLIIRNKEPQNGMKTAYVRRASARVLCIPATNDTIRNTYPHLY